MDGWIKGWIDGLMDGWTDRWIVGKMDEWTDYEQIQEWVDHVCLCLNECINE